MNGSETVTMSLKHYREMVEEHVLSSFIIEYCGYNKLSGEEMRRMYHALTLFINEGHCDTGDVK